MREISSRRLRIWELEVEKERKLDKRNDCMMFLLLRANDFEIN